MLVRPTASPRTITVAADDAEQRLAAQTTYSVRALADLRPRLVKVRGDSQTGAPGAVLGVPLRVQLVDESNNPLAGVAIAFRPSPGAALTRAASVTDSNGEAEAVVRLPAREGITLIAVEALPAGGHLSGAHDRGGLELVSAHYRQRRSVSRCGGGHSALLPGTRRPAVGPAP
jgi:hypothetical protein